MRKLFLFLLMVLLFSVGYSQTYKKVKIYINQKSDIQRLYKAGLEFDHAALTKDKAIIVFLNDKEFENLKTSGLQI